MINIVIPEPIPSMNKGEIAILDGLREALKLYGEYNLSVYSPPFIIDDDIRNAKGQYNVVGGIDLFDLENAFLENPIPRGRFYFFKTWGKLILFSLVYKMNKTLSKALFNDPLLLSIADADLILANHDGMLNYLHFYLVLSGKIMGKPVALYGGGNDLKGRSSFKVRKFFQFAVKHSIICTVRDPGSYDYLIENDVPAASVHLFPDPAVMLPPCDNDRVFEILNQEGVPLPDEKPLYGLIPVRGGIVFNKSFTAETDLEKKHALRVNLWVNVLTHLIDTTEAHFVFLPHCIGPGKANDDRRMSRDIFNALPEDKKQRVTLIESDFTAGELKGLMKNFQYVLGERTHGLIGSVSAATPCIALTTEEDLRMHYIMENMFERSTYNLNNPDVEELKQILSDEWSKRDVIAVAMKIKAEQIKAEANKAANLLSERIREAIHHGK